VLCDIAILATKGSNNNFRWALSKYRDRFLFMFNRIKFIKNVDKIMFICDDDAAYYKKEFGGMCEIITAPGSSAKESGYGLRIAAECSDKPFFFMNCSIVFHRMVLNSLPRLNTGILYSEARNKKMGIEERDGNLIAFTPRNSTEWAESGFISDNGRLAIKNISEAMCSKMFLFEYIDYIFRHTESVKVLKIKKNWVNLRYENRNRIIEVIHG